MGGGGIAMIKKNEENREVKNSMKLKVRGMKEKKSAIWEDFRRNIER